MKDPNVKCLVCGIDFYKKISEIKRFANHFCNLQCKYIYQDKKTEIKCLTCGIDFYKTASKIKRSANHFCSRECSSKNKDQKVEVKCLNCKIDLYRTPYEIKRYKNHFCSRECSSKNKDQKVEVKCLNCNKFFLKKHDQIQKKPRHCCSIQCYRILAKYNKNWGSSRSKLEIYVEQKLTEELTLNISYNDTSIGYELDIYSPEMSFAIELNGVFHYKAIFGEKSLLKRQEIDRLKAEECVKRNIKLIVINVSEDKDNKRTLEKRYNEIKSLILNRFEEYKQQSSQPITLEF